MGDQIDRRRVNGPDDSCRRGYRGQRRLRSLGEIVRDYESRFRPRAASELSFFAGMGSFDEAVTEAGLARKPNGKRWAHQRRIPAPTIQEATRRLHRADLKGAQSFDELLTWIEQAVQTLRGIGELYAYDTALRIGSYLGKLPRRVYLHAGTRVGVAALGLDPKERSIDLKQLPAPLAKLKLHEAEDVLCIYKEWLVGARSG